MTPVTRREIYLSRATGSGEDVPTPITREEQYLEQICDRLDNVAAPTDEQVAEAVSSYLDERTMSHADYAIELMNKNASDIDYIAMMSDIDLDGGE